MHYLQAMLLHCTVHYIVPLHWAALICQCVIYMNFLFSLRYLDIWSYSFFAELHFNYWNKEIFIVWLDWEWAVLHTGCRYSADLLAWLSLCCVLATCHYELNQSWCLAHFLFRYQKACDNRMASGTEYRLQSGKWGWNFFMHAHSNLMWRTNNSLCIYFLTIH